MTRTHENRAYSTWFIGAIADVIWEPSSMLYDGSLDCWVYDVQCGHQFCARKQYYVKCVTTETETGRQRKCIVGTVSELSSRKWTHHPFFFLLANSIWLDKFSSWLVNSPHCPSRKCFSRFDDMYVRSFRNECCTEHWIVHSIRRWMVCIYHTRSSQRVPSVSVWRHSAP